MKVFTVFLLCALTYVSCKPLVPIDVLKDEITNLKEKVEYVKDHPSVSKGNDNPDALLSELKRLKDEVLEDKAAEQKDAEAAAAAEAIKKEEKTKKKDEKVEEVEDEKEVVAGVTADEVTNYKAEIADMKKALKDTANLKNKAFLTMMKDEASHLKAEILSKIESAEKKDTPVAVEKNLEEHENDESTEAKEVAALPSHDDIVQEKLAKIKQRLDNVREKLASNPEMLKDQALKDQVVNKLKAIKVKLGMFQKDVASKEETTEETIAPEEDEQDLMEAEDAADMEAAENEADLEAAKAEADAEAEKADQEEKLSLIKQELDAIRKHLIEKPLKDEQLKKDVAAKLVAIHKKLQDAKQKITGEEIVNSLEDEKKDEAPKAPMTKDVMARIKAKLDHIKEELKDNPIQDVSLKTEVLDKLHTIHQKLKDAVQAQKDVSSKSEIIVPDTEALAKKEAADIIAESPEKKVEEPKKDDAEEVVDSDKQVQAVKVEDNKPEEVVKDVAKVEKKDVETKKGILNFSITCISRFLYRNCETQSKVSSLFILILLLLIIIIVSNSNCT
jgi:hypothetical protein